MRFLHGATSTEVRSEARFDDDEVALGGNLRNFHATQIAHDQQNPHIRVAINSMEIAL